MSRRQNRVNRDWETPLEGWTWDHVQLELLMDIRHELQKLNAVFACANFQEIPRTLRSIRRKLPPLKPRTRA